MSSLPSLAEIHGYAQNHFPLLVDNIERPYHYIFPEYPFAGVLVFGLALLMLVIYLLQSGVEVALKMFVFIIVSLTLILLALHWLNGPFHLFTI